MISKDDLKPFTKVKAKNGQHGILVLFEDSELMVFPNIVIFLSRYNNDLTLQSLYGLTIEGDLDSPLKEYRYNLLAIKEDYYGYEIVEIYQSINFNNFNKVINFDYLKQEI